MYYKIFSEIRYPSNVEFFDSQSRLLKQFWPDEFLHWQKDGQNNILRFHNGTNEPTDSKIISSEILVLSFKNLIFSVEDPSTRNYFLERFQKLLKLLSKSIEINEISRLGLRAILCIDTINFDKIIEKTNEGKIFQKELITNIKDDYQIEDYSIVLQQKNSRFELGPMKKSQQHPNLLNNFVFLEKVPDEFLYLDVDVSTTMFKYGDFKKTYINLENKLWDYISSFQKTFEIGGPK